MRQLLPVAKNLTSHPQNKNVLSWKLTAEILTILVTLLTEDLLLRLQLVQCSSAEWTWHTFSMKWGNFCPWLKISLAILKMNRNCLHWLRMPLMFLHPFHFPNFPFSSVLFNAQNNLLTSKASRVFFYYIIAKGSEMAIFTIFQDITPNFTMSYYKTPFRMKSFAIICSITKWKIAISDKKYPQRVFYQFVSILRNMFEITVAYSCCD